MKAVILVGGEGTRLRPLTTNIPKPMVPVVNRPFLEHVILHLRQHSIKEIILTTCYLPSAIQQYFGDGGQLGVSLVYAVEETPLGTAGAVKNVAHLLDDTFIVLNGDIFSSLNITEMLAAHRQAQADGTLHLVSVEDPTIYGVVETDARGWVLRFIEKPSWDAVTTNRINAGTYLLEPSVLEYIPDDMPYMFEHGLFPKLLQEDRVLYSHTTADQWIDIGTPQKYLALNHDMLYGRFGGDLHGELIDTEIWAEGGCAIHSTARLRGPIALGSHCTIGPGASLLGPCVLGDGCRVGEEAVLENSVLWRDVQVGRRSQLRNCIVSDHCNIGNEVWLTDGVVLGSGVSLGDGNRLSHGIRVQSGVSIEPSALSF